MYMYLGGTHKEVCVYPLVTNQFVGVTVYPAISTHAFPLWFLFLYTVCVPPLWFVHVYIHVHVHMYSGEWNGVKRRGVGLPLNILYMHVFLTLL